MKFKGVIFDFNGVVIDDYLIQKAAWDKTAKRLRGKSVSDSEMMTKIRGTPSEATIVRLSPKPLTKKEIDRLAEEKEAVVKNLYETSSLYRLNKGLDAFLNTLKKNLIPITIATSSPYKMAKFSFNRLDLKRWFDWEKIVYQNYSHKGKPAPDAYLLAAEKLGLSPKVCVVFEDAKSGVTSAYRAGIGKIIVVGRKELVKLLSNLPGVAEVIRDFTEIHIESLLNS